MKNIFILFILMISLSGCYSSGILYDTYKSDSAYIVVKQDMSVSSPWVRNFSLPKTITAYIVSDFTYREGTVKMDNNYKYSNAYSGNYRLENVSGYTVYEIPFTDNFKNVVAQQKTSEMNIINITFSISDLLNNNNELLYQPAGLALIEGIKNSKKSSGQACLFELKYTGNGKFEAKVGVR